MKEQNEFLEFLEKQVEKGGELAAASILFELEREESLTNSQYSAAHAAVREILGPKYTKELDDMFREIQQDENDHAAKFQQAGSKIVGIGMGNPNH